jgi:hypothetical protein
MTSKTPTDAFVEAVEELDGALAVLEAPADPLITGREKLAAHRSESLTPAEIEALTAVASHKSADEILATDDTETEDVYVPQWDTLVTIRSLTGTERDRYEASLVSYRKDALGRPVVDKMELGNIRARLISLVALDGKGRQMWSPQQVLPLGQKNGSALDVLFTKAQALSNITAPAIEAAKEALGKDQSDAPGSDSQAISG